MKLLRNLMVVATTVLLSACTYVSTEVESFSTIPNGVQPPTVYIKPAPGMDGNSLAWQSNASILAGLFAEKGYVSVPAAKARLTAALGYSIDNGRQQTRTESVPMRGVVGYETVPVGNPADGKTIQRPIYGTVGFNDRLVTDTIYTRRATVSVTDNTTGKQVFQGTGVSRGECPAFAPVAQPLLAAIMSKFPQGGTGTVVLESQDNNCGT